VAESGMNTPGEVALGVESAWPIFVHGAQVRRRGLLARLRRWLLRAG